MYPELFRIGDFQVHTYGVLMALSLLTALFVAAWLGARDGLPRDRIYDIGLWMLVGGLAGSKLLMLWVEPVYQDDPWNLLSLDFVRSAGVFYGGFLGGVTVGYILMRRFGLPWWRTADAFAPGVALAQVIGRLGCFAAGCCWGEPTTLPWGVKFSRTAQLLTGVPSNVHLHPTQLYESGAVLAVFGFLIWLHRRKTFDGQVVLVYAVLYSIARFLIEFVRDDPRGDVAGLTSLTGLSTSQLISLLVGLSAIVLLFIRSRRAPSTLPRNGGDGTGGGDGGGGVPTATTAPAATASASNTAPV